MLVQNLKLHDFAFMRAVIEGVDAARAARLYLPEGAEDPHAARALFEQLMGTAIAQLKSLADVDSANGARKALLANSISNEKMPSLDAFVERYDTDVYGERELMDLFEIKHGSLPDKVRQREAKIRALHWLQLKAARIPRQHDAVANWFCAELCGSFRAVGVLSLGDCITFINSRGRLWHRGFKRLGRVRATRLVQWLAAHESHLQMQLSGRVRAGLQSTGSAPVPLSPVRETVAVVSGTFCSGVNTMGATSDGQALQGWLGTLATKSAHTVEAYRREVERLLVWAARERGKGLSSIDAVDAGHWLMFLTDPPAHWVNALPCRKTDEDWRPLRHGLSARSAARALAAVNNLYGFLVATNYLVANPFARLQPRRSGAVQLDVSRSFTNADLQAIWAAAAALPAGAHQRRMVAVLHLLLSAGLRREELVNLRWGHLKPLRIDGDVSEHFGLTVLGKGMKERVVPLRPQAVEALRRHRDDRLQLVALGTVRDVPEDEIPLISSLRSSHWSMGATTDGSLSVAGVYSLIKQFFRQMAKQGGGEGLSDFSQASVHWLRHTFAHQVLAASGNDLPVAQQLLGHASIATTGIYVKADVRQRLQAVLAMSSLVGPSELS